MFINIGQKIRVRREEKGVTQDEFANYLGVTCKEVLKWENGEIYPSFELIPVIANYFGVSTDELLCMEMFDNEDKIRQYSDTFNEKVAAGDIKGAVDTVREGLLHFPDDYRLKATLMYGLYLSCERPAVAKHYSPELLELADDILAHCTSDPIRLDAKRLLCLHCFEDLEDTEKAREIARSLPGRKICREDMLPIISQGDAKIEAIQENISAYATLLSSAITSYTENMTELSISKKIEFCELARIIRDLVYPSRDYYESAYIHMTLLRDLAVLYMSEGSSDKALDCLEDCAKTAAAFDALPKHSTHISPLVNRLKFSKQQLQIPIKNKKTPLGDIFMSEIMQLRCFEPIRYSERITDICNIFKTSES